MGRYKVRALMLARFCETADKDWRWIISFVSGSFTAAGGCIFWWSRRRRPRRRFPILFVASIRSKEKTVHRDSRVSLLQFRHCSSDWTENEFYPDCWLRVSCMERLDEHAYDLSVNTVEARCPLDCSMASKPRWLLPDIQSQDWT